MKLRFKDAEDLVKQMQSGKPLQEVLPARKKNRPAPPAPAPSVGSAPQGSTASPAAAQPAPEKAQPLTSSLTGTSALPEDKKLQLIMEELTTSDDPLLTLFNIWLIMSDGVIDVVSEHKKNRWGLAKGNAIVNAAKHFQARGKLIFEKNRYIKPPRKNWHNIDTWRGQSAAGE